MRTSGTSQKASTADAVGLPYLPGLDGLRAVAVAGVLLYHAGLGASGGFLGVETFFVLSGYLITALLLLDWQRYQQVRLGPFWLRRARRLLPALALLLLGTAALVALWVPEEAATLRSDMLAALGYVMNWHLILGQQSYFDPLLRPPLLQHLWSLAVEEQFYLVWPLLVAGGLRRLGRRGLLLATLLGAAASTLLMARLYQPGLDPSRVYYGTDTRASALLLGSALAMVWMPGQVPAAQSRRVGLALDLGGGLALGGLLLGYARLFEYHPLLYRGGFALIALLTALGIAAVVHPQARVLGALLGVAPLRWLGLRSYGIYLWHWPIFMVSRPFIDVELSSWPLQCIRFGVVLVLADLSYRLVEMPIRNGVLGRVNRRIRTAAAPVTATLGTARRSGAGGYGNGMLESNGAQGPAPELEPVPVVADTLPPRRRHRARSSGHKRRHGRRR